MGETRGAVRVRLLLALLLAFASAHAARAGPDPVPADAAPRGTAHLQRVASLGEAKALDEAQRADEDPWVLAEELLLLGHPEAARAVAKSGLTEDEHALLSYVDRGPRPSREVAVAIPKAEALLAAGKATEAAALVDAGPALGVTVTEARALELRARILDATARRAEATDALSRLAGQAFALGWQRGELAARRTLLDRMPETDRMGRRRTLRRLLELDRDARDLLGSAAWCGKLGALEAGESPRAARRWLLEGEGMLAATAKGRGLPATAQVDRARGLSALALAQRDLGETAAALATALRGYDLAKELGPLVRAEAAAALSKIYRGFGRLEEAEDFMREKARLLRGIDSLGEAKALGDLAWIRMRRGDVEGAASLYEQVRASRALDSDPRGRLVMRLHQAAVAIESPDSAQTVEGLQRAVADLTSVVDEARQQSQPEIRNEIEANADALTGRAFNLLGRPKAAVAPLEEALDGGYAREIPEFRRFVAGELAHALRGAGTPKRALDVAGQALQSLEREMPLLPSSLALDALSQSSATRLLDEALACALEVGQASGLHAMLERTRGMVFLAERRHRRAAGARGLVPLGTAEIAALADDASRAATALAVARSEGVRARIAEARGDLWRSRSLLRNAVERERIDEMVGTVPPSSPPAGPPSLDSSEAILYLAPVGAHCVVLLVSGERLEVVELEGSRSSIEERVAAERRALLGGTSDGATEALARLTRLLIPARARAFLTKTKPLDHVYVSTVGVFSALPWPALLESAFRGREESLGPPPTLSLIASLGVLREVADWTTPAGVGRMLVVGNPDLGSEGVEARAALFGEFSDLPGAAEEARAVADAARGDVLLLGSAAEEVAVRRHLFEGARPFDGVHFACHGRLYGAQPSLSALALRGSANDDGLLTVEEVGAWRFALGPRLVVMSACKSGLGVPVSGDAEEGLVRAFLLAGARNVVASLWPVSDRATRDLMVAFHRIRRAEGLSPCDCLRRAQAEVAAMPSHASPRDWAGWCVWGPRR